MDTEVAINEVLSSALSTEEVKAIGFFKEISRKVKGRGSYYIPCYEYRRSIVSETTEEYFKILYSSESVMKFLEACFGNEYAVDSLFEELYLKFPQLVSDILKNSKRSSLVIYLIKEGFHSGVEDINLLAESDDVQARLFAVTRCSYEVLKKMRNDPEKGVRVAAYKRLGVDEYLDEMLDDPVLDIRLMAAKAAPMYYPKFKDMADELSKEVFKVVAAKIDVKHIPYILGNRNLSTNNASSKYIKALLDKRMTMGNIDYADKE